MVVEHFEEDWAERSAAVFVVGFGDAVSEREYVM